MTMPMLILSVNVLKQAHFELHYVNLTLHYNYERIPITTFYFLKYLSILKFYSTFKKKYIGILTSEVMT
jgi:hypothetical protein